QGAAQSNALLGSGVAAWPLAARAQQPAMPVIGYLSAHLPGPSAPLTGAFRQGLKDSGYVEGENVTIIYRWAEGQWDRLPALATELLHQRVAVIAAFENSPAIAAKAATTTIPIVFSVGEDPVRLGLTTTIRGPFAARTFARWFRRACDKAGLPHCSAHGLRKAAARRSPASPSLAGTVKGAMCPAERSTR